MIVIFYIVICLIIILVIFSDYNFDDIIAFFNSTVENTQLNDIQEFDESSVKNESGWKTFWKYIAIFGIVITLGILLYYGYNYFVVESTIAEPVVNQASDSADEYVADWTADSYSDEYSDEFYAWCEAEGINPNREAVPVTEPKPLKRLDGFLEEDSLD